MTSIRKGIALLALAAALAFPTGSLAAGIDAPASESFDVLATFVLTGIPSSVTYPTKNAFAAGTNWAPAINVIQYGSSTPGASLYMAATNLTSGQNVIPSESRVMYVQNAIGAAFTIGGSEQSIGANYGAPGSTKKLATLDNSHASSSLDLGLGIAMQSSIQAGSYTGTVTISVGP